MVDIREKRERKKRPDTEKVWRVVFEHKGDGYKKEIITSSSKQIVEIVRSLISAGAQEIKIKAGNGIRIKMRKGFYKEK